MNTGDSLPAPAGQTPAAPATPLVCLLSWEGGFCLGQVHWTPRQRTLELRQYGQGQPESRWAVRCSLREGAVDAPAQVLWELWLPMRTQAAARMVFVELHASLVAARQPSPAVASAPALPELAESQLRFLAKTFPRTVALMRAPRVQLSLDAAQHNQALFRAYAEEAFALTGVVVAPPQGRDEVLRMARLYTQASARKRKPDPVEAELIIGCHNKGYWRMTLPQLQAAVRTATGARLTTDALRQKWKRLGLPSARRRGRRKNSPQK